MLKYFINLPTTIITLTLGDGRIEEPPLTYTQGTYGEASRQLYHITNEKYYLTCAEKVISYVTTSDRCFN